LQLPLAPKTQKSASEPSRTINNRWQAILTLGCQKLGCAANAPPDLAGAQFQQSKVSDMAKAVTIKVKLVSSADTGFYYVAKKNSRTMTDKLVKKKYDPVARKHVEFKESKIK
jgi:large subunit ribosomal protein L33